MKVNAPSVMIDAKPAVFTDVKNALLKCSLTIKELALNVDLTVKNVPLLLPAVSVKMISSLPLLAHAPSKTKTVKPRLNTDVTNARMDSSLIRKPDFAQDALKDALNALLLRPVTNVLHLSSHLMVMVNVPLRDGLLLSLLFWVLVFWEDSMLPGLHTPRRELLL